MGCCWLGTSSMKSKRSTGEVWHCRLAGGSSEPLASHHQSLARNLVVQSLSKLSACLLHYPSQCRYTWKMLSAVWQSWKGLQANITESRVPLSTKCPVNHMNLFRINHFSIIGNCLVLVWVLSTLIMSTMSMCTSTSFFSNTSTSTEIGYWSITSTSTKYSGPNPGSEGDEDTLACQNPGHSFLPKKCMETSNLTSYTNQSGAKSRKINRLWPKSTQFWRWSGYINMPNFRPFLPCVLWDYPEFST